jgi:hypothetical protein
MFENMRGIDTARRAIGDRQAADDVAKATLSGNRCAFFLKKRPATGRRSTRKVKDASNFSQRSGALYPQLY